MNEKSSIPSQPEQDTAPGGASPDAQGTAAEQPLEVQMAPLILSPNVDKVEVTTNAINRLKEEHWYPVTIPPNTTYSLILLQPVVADPRDQIVAAAFREFNDTTPEPGGPSSAQGRPPFGSSVAHGKTYTTGNFEESYWFRIAERNGDAIPLSAYVFGIQRVP